MNTENKKKGFLGGAALLMGVGLLVKVIGAVYRIPLTNMIGSDGIGIYQLAYPIYAFLLTASTSGFPVAVSKMVSEHRAAGDYMGAKRIFRLALKLLFGIGCVTFLILLIFSKSIARLQANELSVWSFIAISPALLAVAVMSAYRGYFQGMQNMTPTAVSQLVEQAGKLIFGLLLAHWWYPIGVQYGAAGALLGVTISEFLALITVLFYYRKASKALDTELAAQTVPEDDATSKSLIGKLLGISIPIVIGASVMPLTFFIDSMLVVRRVTPIVSMIEGIPDLVGATSEELKSVATSLYGLMTGCCNTLINFPAILTVSLAMSLVPAISTAFKRNDTVELHKTVTAGVWIAVLLGVPCAAGLAVLAEPIIRLLYNLSYWKYVKAGEILTVLSIAVIFLSMVQTLTAVLQGIGKVKLPVFNLFIGGIVKVILTYVLTGIPKLHVMGAAIGTVCCYAIAAVLDFIALIKNTKVKLPYANVFVKPIIATGVMAVVAHFTYKLAQHLFGNTIGLFATIVIAVVVYVAVLLLLKTFDRETLEALPKGKKIAKLFAKLHLI